MGKDEKFYDSLDYEKKTEIKNKGKEPEDDFFDIDEEENKKWYFEHIEQREEIDIEKLGQKKIESLSEEKIKNLTENQIKEFSTDQIRCLLPSQIKMLGEHQIKAMSPKQVESLRIQQIRAIRPEQIKAFSKEQLITLKNWQIKELEKEQVIALKPEQIKELLPEQIKAFKTFAITALGKEQLQAITKEQLQTIEPYKLGLLTKEQLGFLKPEQINNLNKKQVGLIMEKIPLEQYKFLPEKSVVKNVGKIKILPSERYSELLKYNKLGAMSSVQRMNIKISRVINRKDVKVKGNTGKENMIKVRYKKVKNLLKNIGKTKNKEIVLHSPEERRTVKSNNKLDKNINF